MLRRIHTRWRHVAVVALFALVGSSRSFAPARHSLSTTSSTRRSILIGCCRRRPPTTFLTSVSSSSEEEAEEDQQDDKRAILKKLSLDLDKLSILRPPIPSADLSMPVAIISAGSSYTRIWTHSTWKSHGDPPHVRYRKHILRWAASSTARKIMPAVLLATAWATVLSVFVNSQFSQPWCRNLLVASGSAPAFSFLSAPLVLLLTVRANASMTRLLEGRLLWGQLVLHCRSLASIARIYLFPHCPAASALAIRHVAMMGWILKAALRGESKESEDAVLASLLSGNDFAWLAQQPKRIVAVTSRTRQICAHCLTKIDNERSGSLQLVLEEKISALEAVVGGCERLFASPIPPTYNRHLSRVLCMWLFLMPISLIGSGLSIAGVVMATTVASYVTIGLDEVAMEIEAQHDMLPLQQLAGAVQNDVRAQFVQDGGEMPCVSS